VAQLGATALGILWWLYAARVLTEVIGLVLMRRVGHSGRLLQDVIGTGVVRATVPDGAGQTEAGRMGPSEVMGKQSILTDTPSQATLTTLTSYIIYRIDKSLTRHCMEQRVEVSQALNKLQAVRTQSSRFALMAKPAPIKKEVYLDG